MRGYLKNTGLAAIAAGMILYGVSSPALAGSQYVVVAADPPAQEYAPGKVLNVDDTINIPEGTIVTLLGEDGSVNAIPGPASITVTEDSVETVGANSEPAKAERRSTMSKIADLLSGEQENADTLGVARSFGNRPKPKGLDDPWVISIHSDGEGCFRNSEIKLGRKSDKEALGIAIAGDDESKQVELTMRQGVSEVLLPGSVPIDKGEIFIKAGSNRALVQLHSLPAEINTQNPVDLLGWMLASGCEGQAVALTRQLVLEAQ
ncbi:MAG: hypothetical protein AAF362_05290 [Pseudomonadota bacterium]